MTPRQLLRIFISLLVVSISLPALAANKDNATLKKIDEALNVHYIAADYDKAEKVLQSAIQACGTKSCSGGVLAKAYVAVGVIRGNARQDLAGARTAFENAKAADPNATLDATLVTPQVLAEFYKVMEREMPPELANAKPASEAEAEAPPPEVKETGPARVSPAGDLRCTPVSAHEIQTAQPIAVVCEPLEGVVRAELYYRNEGEGEYVAILMSVVDGTLRATIPCEAVTKKGKLEVYIIAQDFNKEMIDTFGNIVTPAHYRIVDKTKEPVPSFPGTAPPKRCNELLLGVANEGEACSPTQACKHGLYCAEGTCLKAQTCETDSDCESKHCTNGFCAMDQESPEVETEPSKLMFGLHGALDIWLAPSVKQMCGKDNLLAGDYSCYNRGEDVYYLGDSPQTAAKTNRIPMANEGQAGNVDAGIRLATMRVLLSGDYVLKNWLSVGGRLGWAFGGGPRAIKFTDGTPSQTKRFFPAHIEGRGTLWLRSLGKPGLHPYVHLTAGFAEVDAKTPIDAKLTVGTEVITRKLDAWRKMGTFFVGGGGGVLYNFPKVVGLQLNLNVMYMLPSTGLILEPSFGVVFRF